MTTIPSGIENTILNHKRSHAAAWLHRRNVFKRPEGRDDDDDQEDIENQRRRSSSSSRQGEECPVCFETLDHTNVLKDRRCGHRLCSACHERLEEPKKCPLCRGDMDGWIMANTIFPELTKFGVFLHAGVFISCMWTVCSVLPFDIIDYLPGDWNVAYFLPAYGFLYAAAVIREGESTERKIAIMALGVTGFLSALFGCAKSLVFGVCQCYLFTFAAFFLMGCWWGYLQVAMRLLIIWSDWNPNQRWVFGLGVALLVTYLHCWNAVFWFLARILFTIVGLLFAEFLENKDDME